MPEQPDAEGLRYELSTSRNRKAAEGEREAAMIAGWTARLNATEAERDRWKERAEKERHYVDLLTDCLNRAQRDLLATKVSRHALKLTAKRLLGERDAALTQVTRMRETLESEYRNISEQLAEAEPESRKHYLLAGYLAGLNVARAALSTAPTTSDQTATILRDVTAAMSQPTPVGDNSRSVVCPTAAPDRREQAEGLYPPDVYYDPIVACVPCPDWRYDAYTRAYQCFHHPYCGCGKHPAVAALKPSGQRVPGKEGS